MTADGCNCATRKAADANKPRAIGDRAGDEPIAALAKKRRKVVNGARLAPEELFRKGMKATQGGKGSGG